MPTPTPARDPEGDVMPRTLGWLWFALATALYLTAAWRLPVRPPAAGCPCAGCCRCKDTSECPGKCPAANPKE